MARPRDHQRDHQVDAHEALDNDGFVAVPGVLDAPQARLAVAILGDLVAESRRQPGGAAEGHADKLTGGTLHLEGLEHRGTALPAVWEDPGVVAAVRHHLGPAAALRTATYRAPLPGRGGQTLHVDWAGFVAEGDWQVCNAIVALVDFTAANGATRVVPGTHRHPDRRFRPRSPLDRHPRQQLLTGPAGTAFVFSGHVLHSGTVNRGTAPRHALLATWQRPAAMPPYR